MKKNLSCCLLVFLTGLPCWAFCSHTWGWTEDLRDFYGPWMPGLYDLVPQEANELPFPVVQVVPQGNDYYAFYGFFNQFLLTEGTVEELVILAQIREVDPQNLSELYLILLERFSWIGEEAQECVARIHLLLQDQGVTPFFAFARTLYERIGASPAESAARAQTLLTEATLRHDSESAFWIRIFKSYGLNDIQAERAYFNMWERLRSGTPYWHAFWRAVLAQFYFRESSIISLNHLQERFLQEGMDAYQAFIRALFFCSELFGGLQFAAQARGAFTQEIEDGRNMVGAFYHHFFLQAGLGADRAENATNRLRELFEADGTICPNCRHNAYFVVLYNAYGFPPALACAMASFLDDQYQNAERSAFEDPFRYFWEVAFRFMGIDEAQLGVAFGQFVGHIWGGAPYADAFVATYISMLTQNFCSVYNAYLSLGQGSELRLFDLLFVVWRESYPEVPEDTIRGAIGGFCQSPSTLSGILDMLKKYKKDD